MNSQTSRSAWLLTHWMVLIQLSPELQSAWQKARETSRVSSSFLDYAHLPSPFPFCHINAHSQQSWLIRTWWLDWSVCTPTNPPPSFQSCGCASTSKWESEREGDQSNEVRSCVVSELIKVNHAGPPLPVMQTRWPRAIISLRLSFW